MSNKKTAIVTGASGGIGAGLVEDFLKEGYNVVATSRNVSQSLTASPSLVLVDGDIGKQQTAACAVGLPGTCTPVGNHCVPEHDA